MTIRNGFKHCESGMYVTQGIQHLRDCTITIEMAVCPMADRGTQMGPMAVQVMGPCMGPMP